MLMRIFAALLILVSLASQNIQAQNNPYGILENQSTLTYDLVQLDPLTGNVINLVPIPGMTSFVIPDQSVIDYHQNHYNFSGFANSVKTLYTIDFNNSILVNSIAFPQNVLGLQYNCNDSLIYGLYEIGNSYSLVTLDPITATLTTISSISAPLSAYTGGTFTLDAIQNLYSFVVHDGSGLRLYAFDIHSGTLVHNNSWISNVVGQVFNGADSSIYGVLEVGADYNLVSVDVSSGTFTTIGTLAGVTPGFFTDATSISQNGTYVFRGFNASNNPAVFTVDVQTATVLSNQVLPTNVVGYEIPVCFTGQTVDVEDQVNDIDISIYPNPVTDNIYLQINNTNSQIENIYVFNSIGAKEFIPTIVNINSSGIIMDVSALQAGLFFLHIQTRNQVIIKSFIKYIK